MPRGFSPEPGRLSVDKPRGYAPACLGLIAVMLLGTARAGADDRTNEQFFESRIRPVLIDKCYACHSAKASKLKGGLRLDDRERMRKGGDSGPAVVPGSPEESLLIQAIAGTGEVPRMPPKEVLTDDVIKDFRRWIERGAEDPRTPAAVRQASAKTLAGRGSGHASPTETHSSPWWSLRPIASPAVPRIDGPAGGWVRTPIDAFILTTLQQHGLHPAPEADRRTLIRRLSFDLIGLPPTPSEVEAFLADPSPDAYDRLVDRLLASPHHGERWARHWMDLVHFAETHGHDQDRIRPNAWPYRDYLIAAFNQDRPFARFVEEQVAADVLFPEEPARVVALGMIAAGPWDESSLRDIRDDSLDRQVGRYLDRDDMLSTVMSTFVSLTVHCARCHDHKFDPIMQEDYYGLQAVFAGVDRADRNYDPDPAVGRLRQVLGLDLRLMPGHALGWVMQLAALPPRHQVYAAASDFVPDGTHRPAGGPRPVHILKRGDINKPGPAAEPGSLACVTSLPGRFSVHDPRNEGMRRAALARWLSDARNPLTCRSIVNRLWQYHFGRGIVDTPSDFGRMGAIPSHPELLDWLAARFLAEGGSLKRMHRLIVTSATYRQATVHDRRASERDAENHLLWRMNRRRLDAESVRDAMLLASGRLDRTMGGPSVKQFSLRPGVHVTPVIDYSQYDWNRPGAGRRSVYRFLFRSLPDPFMDSLDGADASQLTPARTESITPLQALALLNDPFVLNQSEHLAARLERDASTLDGRVRLAFSLVFNRPPTKEELADLGPLARDHGLTNFCRVLLNSNEFLFVN